ncbi:Peroxidasin homolog [Seminavis robusta]|uniref:Peroxidasin homolog n=1 Tax=Seminavis robusta TaxID=568900 RepID=A0A9N8I134_9STRA|nr:Peroxidasin homolog [Seminavis robusta]|eukprot:Sro3085_g343420.1 Peroxidasin homolog (565) ;mRNA; r:5595-7710
MTCFLRLTLLFSCAVAVLASTQLRTERMLRNRGRYSDCNNCDCGCGNGERSGSSGGGVDTGSSGGSTRGRALHAAQDEDLKKEAEEIEAEAQMVVKEAKHKLRLALHENMKIPLTKVRSIAGLDRDDYKGSAETPLMRMIEETTYTDQKSDMPHGRNARTVSSLMCKQDDRIYNAKGLSDMVWAWGQFLDHDIDLTDSAGSFGMANIEIYNEYNDDVLAHNGCSVIPFHRSQYVEEPRQQVNLITHFVDGSNVYGSDEYRARALRAEHDGLLKTSNDGWSLPYNTEALTNAGGTGSHLYLAGDIRANEHAGLTSMHTLFVREHNRLARKIKYYFKDASSDDIYELARKIVGAEMQKITYYEFLPALLGPYAPNMQRYRGYKRKVDPRIWNEFSTVIYRFGHSMVTGDLKLAKDGRIFDSVDLRDIFFNPGFLNKDDTSYLNADYLIGGFMSNQAQELDVNVVRDLQDFLFSSTNSNSSCLDLASMNIQRARDHGLQPYNIYSGSSRGRSSIMQSCHWFLGKAPFSRSQSSLTSSAHVPFRQARGSMDEATLKKCSFPRRKCGHT